MLKQKMGSNTPSPNGEGEDTPPSSIAKLPSPPSSIASKWLGFVSALWVQAISGNNYTFANYSVELKAILRCNQVQLNGLSSAKDVGKAFGVVAGLLSDYLPPWTILLIGSVEGFLGYGAQWLVISKKIHPLPYWLMCIVMCMGGNSTTWMNTAVLVTCVRNFRQNRGPASGILKAYVGLSTAIFTDLCSALFNGDAASFVLMLALIPLGVCIVAMFLLKPAEPALKASQDQGESRCFAVLNVLAIVLALYLLTYDLSGIKSGLYSKLIAGGLCIILVFPAALPVYLHRKVVRSEPVLEQKEKEQGESKKAGHQQLAAMAERSCDVEKVSEVVVVEGSQREKEGGEPKREGLKQAAMAESDDVEKVCEVVEGSQRVKEQGAEKREGRQEVRVESCEVELDRQRGKEEQGEPRRRSEEQQAPRAESGVEKVSEVAEGEKEKREGQQVRMEIDVEKVSSKDVVAEGKSQIWGKEQGEPPLREGQQAARAETSDVEKVTGEVDVQGSQRGAIVSGGKKKLGDEFTVVEALKTADFWLLFFCFLCGVGTGMAVINNLGQIGQSMGYSSVAIFVSFISIWGFFGRLGSGALSEYLIRWKAMPRTVLLAVSQLVMVLGYVMLATGAKGSLYIGSIVVGVCFGVRLAVSVPVVSEMFGLKALGLMYNLLILNLPLGSFLFSSLLAGVLYDREAAKQGSTTCLGAQCYRFVFLVMAAVSGLGFILDSILTLRTRSLYQHIHRSKLSSGR